MILRSNMLTDLTWPEVADAAAENIPVVLAVGSVEQHGPHLPLCVDTLLPVRVALEVAKSEPILIAPPIHYGAKSRPLSGGGESFPGTVSLRATTLLVLLEDVLSGLIRGGFRRLVIYNWHFENAPYLWEAADTIRAIATDSGSRIVVMELPMPAFSDEELDALFPDEFPGWDVEHAGIMETSMMLAAAPELVRTEHVVDDEAARRPAWQVVPAPAEFTTATGVYWHATKSSQDVGVAFLDAAARHLLDAIQTEF